jgi:hypothetical protein
MNIKCKVCNNEKSEDEFSKRYKNICKVCWFLNNKTIEFDEVFTLSIVTKILDLLLNKKINYVNDLASILNIDFLLIIEFLSKVKINGEGNKVKVLCNCNFCNKQLERNVYDYKNKDKYFCNSKCMHDWQAINWKGNKSANYTSSELHCDWCNKLFTKPQNAIKRSKKHFCCLDCKNNYHNNVFFKSDEWTEMNRRFALEKLSNGTFKTDNKLQQKINSLLDKNNIEYKNEVTFDKWSVDNYLINNNLVVEVNGDYWHCNKLNYSCIQYEAQLNRIRCDIVKQKYLLTNHNIHILYLWESDIDNNFDLCQSLLMEYIRTNGNLQNYHSFNYSMINDQLLLNKNLIVPYMDLSKNDLLPFIKLKNK